jgi:hypothetical protein
MTDHNALAPRSNPSPTGDRAARAYLSRCFDSALSTMLRAHTACTNRAAVLSTMAGAVRDHSTFLEATHTNSTQRIRASGRAAVDCTHTNSTGRR